jgi:adenylate cyclase
MPEWNRDYYQQLQDRFQELAQSLQAPIEDVATGRVAPALDDIAIGSGRRLRGAALYFDIRGFTKRTVSSDPTELRRTLIMLDCVIPTVMQVVYDHGGYIEKNTGDGIMALVGLGEPDAVAANSAIDIAVTTFCVLANILNPALQRAQIAPVEARIGIDLGPMLIARIGTHTGSSAHQRNFLTAVGPSANIACKLQAKAGTNQIWVGDLVKTNAHQSRQQHFVRKDEADLEWIWIYQGTTNRYHYWHYNAYRANPNA